MNEKTECKSSVTLLKECDAGVKMAIKSIDDILDHASDEKLKEILEEARKRHVNLKSDIEKMLEAGGEDEKEPNPIATGMAYMKTNIKITMEDDDRVVADLITDGCNMGIKSLSRYLNKHRDASEEIKELAKKLIKSEEELLVAVRPYL